MNIWYLDYIQNYSFDDIEILTQYQWEKEAISRQEQYDPDSTDEETKANEEITRGRRITTAMEIREAKVEILTKTMRAQRVDMATAVEMMRQAEAEVEESPRKKAESLEVHRGSRGRSRSSCRTQRSRSRSSAQ